jgi:hypothetical protein
MAQVSLRSAHARVGDAGAFGQLFTFQRGIDKELVNAVLLFFT